MNHGLSKACAEVITSIAIRNNTVRHRRGEDTESDGKATM